MNKADRTAYRAKQVYDMLHSGQYKTESETVLKIIGSDTIKREEIISQFCTMTGTSKDAAGPLVDESLKALMDSKKIERVQHGYYRAV